MLPAPAAASAAMVEGDIAASQPPSALGYSPARWRKLPSPPGTQVRWTPTPCRERCCVCRVAEAAGHRVASPAAASFCTGDLPLTDTFPWKPPPNPALTYCCDGNFAALCLNRHRGAADGLFFAGPPFAPVPNYVCRQKRRAEGCARTARPRSWKAA